MNWQQARAIFLGVMLSWLCLPSVGRAGWITLTGGTTGNAQPTGTSEFRYGSATTPFLAIDTLTGAGTVQATTGGGTSFFSGLGTPVLLNLSDGSAYVAGGSPPAGVTDRGPGGTPASTAPQTGVPVPPDYARVGIVLTAPDVGDSWVLTASVLDGSGGALGSGSLVVPESGWWVLGLGPNQEPAPEPLPDPTPVPTPAPELSPPPSPVPGVPEPATVALAASGLFLALPWLRRNRRVLAVPS